jgi:hypothetical protein
VTRSAQAAETRAAFAALPRLPLEAEFDLYLLIDDSDEFGGEIVTLLRERSPRATSFGEV